MPLDLSTVAVLEKNKRYSTGAWLVLFEIKVSPDYIIRVCINNEDIIWNGHIWYGFPLELDEVRESSKGELPHVVLKVSNVTRTVQRYVEEANGGVDSEVILRVVHSEHLDSATPEIEETFAVKTVSCDANWVYFELGPDFTTNLRIPPDRYRKNFCPFKYKGIRCGATSEHEKCNKTLGDCRERNNSHRFGGQAGIPAGVSLYV